MIFMKHIMMERNKDSSYCGLLSLKELSFGNVFLIFHNPKVYWFSKRQELNSCGAPKKGKEKMRKLHKSSNSNSVHSCQAQLSFLLLAQIIICYLFLCWAIIEVRNRNKNHKLS